MECKNPSLPLQHLQEDSPPSKSQKQQVKCNILEVNLPDIGMNPRRRRFWDQQQKCFQSRVWKLKKGLRKTIVPSKRAFEEGLKLEACNSSFASKQSVKFVIWGLTEVFFSFGGIILKKSQFRLSSFSLTFQKAQAPLIKSDICCRMYRVQCKLHAI